MISNDAARAQATVIENYANVMQSKGLTARAKWARDEARKIMDRVEAVASARFAPVAFDLVA